MKPDPSNPDHRNVARMTPAGWAWFCGRGDWVLYEWLRRVDEAAVDAVATGTNLLIQAPPRHGKSEYVSRALSGWFLGRWPAKRVIHASYGLELSMDFGRKIRADLNEHGPSVFGVRADPASSAAHRFGIHGHAGSFWGVGVGGGLTGRGGNLLLTDDTTKDAEAARSKLQRDNLWSWFTSVFLTRREPGAIHIGIATRWSEDDIHGRILAEMGDRYRLLSLPALAEDDDPLGRARGEALCPERYDVAALERIRDELPSYEWAALYQQRPAPEEGGLWKRAWWDGRTWAEEQRQGERWIVCADGYAVPLSGCVRFAVVDLATSEREAADYTAILACALTPERPRRLVLLDMDRRRMEAPEIMPSVRRMLDRWGLSTAYLEEQGNQKWGAQFARMAGIPCRTVGVARGSDLRVPGDKVACAYAAAPLASAGRLVVPANAAWMPEWEHELLTFPGAHDDMADVTAWACLITAGIPTGASLTMAQIGKTSGPDESRYALDHPAHPTRWDREDAPARKSGWDW